MSVGGKTCMQGVFIIYDEFEFNWFLFSGEEKWITGPPNLPLEANMMQSTRGEIGISIQTLIDSHEYGEIEKETIEIILKLLKQRCLPTKRLYNSYTRRK